MADPIRNFEPNAYWSNPDGTLTERAKGWMRSLFDYIGARVGTFPVTGLGGNGVSTTTFLREDGTFAVPSYPVGSNPSAAIGLAVANGAAVTFMRSDAAPALNLAIVPTWTGAHIFAAGATASTFATTTTLSAGTTLTTGTSATIGTGFGCNGKSAQTSAAVNVAVAGTAGVVYTATEQGIINNSAALLNQIRAALIATGITV